ncbi:uncharacterized protein LOC112905418, partial [Agrilus planipennis]|uniref:Uncharacterized protein LOC112905418 n=1 Tax=Agrilus planipennis TaxID=224129 RepID=A0A7F5RC93_AGRPL
MNLKKQNNKIEISEYRKPTHTDTTIHKNSCHPIQHKHSAFKSMIDRLCKLPLNKNNFNIQLAIIKQIAFSNDLFLKSGVYKLTYNKCNSIYIGQTGRTFKDRINEH